MVTTMTWAGFGWIGAYNARDNSRELLELIEPYP